MLRVRWRFIHLFLCFLLFLLSYAACFHDLSLKLDEWSLSLQLTLLRWWYVCVDVVFFFFLLIDHCDDSDGWILVVLASGLVQVQEARELNPLEKQILIPDSIECVEIADEQSNIDNFEIAWRGKKVCDSIGILCFHILFVFFLNWSFRWIMRSWFPLNPSVPF